MYCVHADTETAALQLPRDLDESGEQTGATACGNVFPVPLIRKKKTLNMVLITGRKKYWFQILL